MAEFLKLLPPEEARRLLLDHMAAPIVHGEEVKTARALHRITLQQIRAPHALPEFSRSTVDGYALMARDTFGASGSQPAYLEIVGEVPMGASADNHSTNRHVRSDSHWRDAAGGRRRHHHVGEYAENWLPPALIRFRVAKSRS